MSRKLYRVPMRFDWPLRKPWQGFINPHHGEPCACSNGSGLGYNAHGKRLLDEWYGYCDFDPSMTGSVPFTVDEVARLHKERRGQDVLSLEAGRLTRLFNSMWMHHLDQADVDALVKHHRLVELTHTWVPETGWKPKEPFETAFEVNRWSIFGLGHDSINALTCIDEKGKRLGYSTLLCPICGGDGVTWPSSEVKNAHEAWEPSGPPRGRGYQVWETVSEGSPISPVFAKPEDLAHYLAVTIGPATPPSRTG